MSQRRPTITSVEASATPVRYQGTRAVAGSAGWAMVEVTSRLRRRTAGEAGGYSLGARGETPGPSAQRRGGLRDPAQRLLVARITDAFGELPRGRRQQHQRRECLHV